MPAQINPLTSTFIVTDVTSVNNCTRTRLTGTLPSGARTVTYVSHSRRFDIRPGDEVTVKPFSLFFDEVLEVRKAAN